MNIDSVLSNPVRQLFHLWNTESELDEGQEFMTSLEAKERNDSLRSLGEPQRWLSLGNVCRRMLSDRPYED